MGESRDKSKMRGNISQKQFILNIFLKLAVFDNKTHFLLFKSFFYFLLNIKIRLVNLSTMSFPVINQVLNQVQKQTEHLQDLINIDNICQNHHFSSNTTCANDDHILDELDFDISLSCNQNQDFNYDNSNQLFFNNLNSEIFEEVHQEKEDKCNKNQRIYLFKQHKMDEQFQSQQENLSLQEVSKQQNHKNKVTENFPATLKGDVTIQLNNKNQINFLQNKGKQKKSIFNPTKNIVKTFLVSFAIFIEKNKKIVEKLIKTQNLPFFSQSFQQDLKYFRKNVRKNLSLTRLRQMLTMGGNQKVYRILTNYYLRKGYVSHLYSPKCKVLGRESYLNHRQSLKQGFMNPEQFTQFLPFLTNIFVQDQFQDEE